MVVVGRAIRADQDLRDPLGAASPGCCRSWPASGGPRYAPRRSPSRIPATEPCSPGRTQPAEDQQQSRIPRKRGHHPRQTHPVDRFHSIAAVPQAGTDPGHPRPSEVGRVKKSAERRSPGGRAFANVGPLDHELFDTGRPGGGRPTSSRHAPRDTAGPAAPRPRRKDRGGRVLGANLDQHLAELGEIAIGRRVERQLGGEPQPAILERDRDKERADFARGVRRVADDQAPLPRRLVVRGVGIIAGSPSFPSPAASPALWRPPRRPWPRRRLS